MFSSMHNNRSHFLHRADITEIEILPGIFLPYLALSCSNSVLSWSQKLLWHADRLTH